MWQSKEEPIPVLRHFGAAGDGLVDDSSAMERYIENLSAHGGGTLFASDGVYGLSHAIVLPQGVSLHRFLTYYRRNLWNRHSTQLKIPPARKGVACHEFSRSPSSARAAPRSR